MMGFLKGLPQKHLAIFFVLFCGIVIGSVAVLSIQSARANTAMFCPGDPRCKEPKPEQNPQPAQPNPNTTISTGSPVQPTTEPQSPTTAPVENTTPQNSAGEEPCK